MNRFNVNVPRFQNIDLHSNIPVVEQMKLKGIKKYGPHVQISKMRPEAIKDLFTPENIIEGIKRHSKTEQNILKKALYKKLLDRFIGDLGLAGDMGEEDLESVVSDATTISEADDEDIEALEDIIFRPEEYEHGLEEEIEKGEIMRDL